MFKLLIQLLHRRIIISHKKKKKKKFDSCSLSLVGAIAVKIVCVPGRAHRHLFTTVVLSALENDPPQLYVFISACLFTKRCLCGNQLVLKYWSCAIQ